VLVKSDRNRAHSAALGPDTLAGYSSGVARE
jgi:hypothetical protein